jgi:hypothetical protein
MKTRNKRIAVLAGVGVLVGGGLAGAFAATSGQDDPAGDLASALSKRTGEQITAAEVKGAFTDMLKQRLQEKVASGKITQAQADQMLERAKNAPLPGMHGGGPGHHGRGGERHQAVEQAITKSLGITEDAWHQAREQGKTPADVAKEKGVEVPTLVDAVTAALKKQGPPPGATARDDAQLKQMATAIVNGEHPGGHGRGGHHDGPRGDWGP